MVLRNDGLMCPYCGCAETTHETDRDDDSVYGCDECDRRFTGPSRS
jgi:ribosomal protein L37AE/L43A